MHHTWQKNFCYLINIKTQVKYKSWIGRPRPVVIRINPYIFSDTSWIDTSCVCSKVRFYSTTTKLIQISSRAKLIITYSYLVYSKTISELIITIASFSEAEGYGFNAQGRKKYYCLLMSCTIFSLKCFNEINLALVMLKNIMYSLT